MHFCYRHYVLDILSFSWSFWCFTWSFVFWHRCLSLDDIVLLVYCVFGSLCTICTFWSTHISCLIIDIVSFFLFCFAEGLFNFSFSYVISVNFMFSIVVIASLSQGKPQTRTVCARYALLEAALQSDNFQQS